MQISSESFNKLKSRLMPEEGYSRYSYKDSMGIETIGYGRNLKVIGISPEEAQILLENDIVHSEQDLIRSLPVYPHLNEARKTVLIDMCFNIGLTKLLGFKDMIKALESNDYDLAAKEMLNSEWAKQVKGRAEQLAYIMKTGVI